MSLGSLNSSSVAVGGSSSEERSSLLGSFRERLHDNEFSAFEHRSLMHRQNIRALSLIVCTFTYLMIGAAVFDALESEPDTDRRELIEMMKTKMQNKYNFSEKDYQVLEHVVIKSVAHKAGLQWQFSGAFYFATVVITTVGYGHSTPATWEGKLFCIFFALAGIPLNLVMFQSIGERLNTLISYCLTKAKRWLRLKRQEVSTTQMIMVSSTLGTLVVVLGTYLFNMYEQWGYFDSFYYCFVTLTTIGFGDYVALQKDGALQNKPEYIVFSLLFILFGMAIFAAAVNLFVLRFMATSNGAEPADRNRLKSVRLRNLTASIDDDDLDSHNIILNKAGLRGGVNSLTQTNSTITPPAMRAFQSTKVALRATKIPKSLTSIVGLRETPFSCSCGGSILKQMNVSKNYYTVRRAPGRISHLIRPTSHRLPQFAHAEGTSDTDSFLLSSTGQRRPSI